MDELPKYRCHKEVWALKIVVIVLDGADHAELIGEGAQNV